MRGSGFEYTYGVETFQEDVFFLFSFDLLFVYNKESSLHWKR